MSSGGGTRPPIITGWPFPDIARLVHHAGPAHAALVGRGGADALGRQRPALAPAPCTRTIAELCADGVRGEIHAHDRIAVRPGKALDYLALLRERGRAMHERYGWELAGAWETLMVDESESALPVPHRPPAAPLEPHRAVGGVMRGTREHAR